MAPRAALDDTPDPATDPPVSGGDHDPESGGTERASPVETKGSTGGREADDPTAGQNAVTDRPDAGTADTAPGEPTADSGVSGDRELSMADVSGDIQSTGTGEYGDFVSVFRDRYERLADLLAGRVNHRPAGAVADLSNGSEVALIGMVADAHSTAGGHWRFVLEDTSGTYPCLVLADSEFADQARRTLHDEVIAVEGRISTDGPDDDGILFVD